MKIHSKKRKHLHSSASSSHSDFREGPSTSSPKHHKLKKRKHDARGSPLVLISSVNKRLKLDKKLRKKMLKRRIQKLSRNSNWIGTPLEGPEVDSLHNISEIYKKHAEESFAFNQERSYSHEDLDTMLEAAQYRSDNDSNEESTSFYQMKKQDIERKCKPSKKKSPHVNFTSVPAKNAVVVLMDHPASVTLNGYVAVEALSGCVSVCGHELKHQDPPVKVFSSSNTGFIQVYSEKFDHLWKRKETFVTLYNYLQKLTGSLKLSRKILSMFGNDTVAIVITKSVLPSNLQFLQVYSPNQFKFCYHLPKLSDKGKRLVVPTKVFRNPMQKGTVNFSHKMEDLASDINGTIRFAKLRDSEGPRVIVYGSQNTGKSTLLRYLMNKALTMFPVIYFLDTDPGQTEFTPPGVVSLTAVSKPVFGPPFAHQRKPVSMCFVGSTSAGSSPDMYSKCIEKLVSLYEQNFVKEPLFVNTMGWMEGIGLECLKNIIKAVRPTVLVEIALPVGDSMFDYREFCPSKVQYFQIPISEQYKSIPGWKSRELSLLSYFGKCQARHERPNYFTNCKPYCVSWDKIPVYKCGRKVAPQRIIESLSASVVALCRVDESQVLESLIQDLPTTLEDEPDNECIGFGIVRAIDEAKHLLYIVSPLSFDEIKHINAIIKGNIKVPNVLFLKQPMVGVPLPFTRLHQKLDQSQTLSDPGEENQEHSPAQSYESEDSESDLASEMSGDEDVPETFLSSRKIAETFGKQIKYNKQIKY